LTYSVTFLTDHKGYSRSRVSGDEYFVDVALDITSYTNGGETITASSVGLSSITSALVTGQEAVNGIATIECTAVTGAYASASTFNVLFLQPSASPQLLEEEANTTNIGTVRVRVYGNL
jgi:hypothetical protein